MNHRSLLVAALAAAHVAAFAQPGPQPDHPGAGPQHRPAAHGPAAHGPAGRAGPGPVAAYPDYHRFQRGERLPPGLRGRQYVVEDWRGHGLRPPPRGYHWVQNGSDYVLAAIATGVISAVVINALTQ
ncbi:MAG: RcnB family protein [Xenophilus sp.]